MIWHTSDNTVSEVHLPSKSTRYDFAADNKVLVALSRDNYINIIDLPSGRLTDPLSSTRERGWHVPLLRIVGRWLSPGDCRKAKPSVGYSSQDALVHVATLQLVTPKFPILENRKLATFARSTVNSSLGIGDRSFARVQLQFARS